MSYNPIFRGNTSIGASRSLQSGYSSGSGSTIPKATLVSTNLSGQMIITDVTSESSINRIVGLTTVDIPSAAHGSVMDSGRLENVTTGFNVGDALYMGKSGALINQKPSVGVAGFVHNDFIVFVGVLVFNEFNPSQKDIKLMISVIGQL